MGSSSATTRLTWTPFVFSLLLLATAGCGHKANAHELPLSTHPLLRLQCPNLTLFHRHATSTHTATCPVPGLLGIFPDLNTDSNTNNLNLPWSFPPKCMTLASSSKKSSPASSYQSASSVSSTSSASSAYSSSSSSLSASASLENDESRGKEIPYCLFTSQPFRNGHGTSLIVSPNTASHLLGLGVFEDRPPPWKWIRQSSRSRSNEQQRTNLAYRIINVAGKGKGVVATRPIKQGEIIMVDYPALLISEEFLRETGREGKGHLRRRMVKRAIEQLPEITREKVWGLMRGPGKYEVDAIMGVNLKGLEGVGSGANSALALLEEPRTEEHGESYAAEGVMGLFAEVARINHSCRPNARLRFVENRATMEVISYRPISPGEEISISYTALTLSPSDRHHFLKQNHQFTCHCPLCTSLSDDPSAKTLTAESHSRRTHLQEVFDTMLHAKGEGFYQDAINILKDWLDFAEVEGLLPLMGEYHGTMAELYLLLAERGSPGDKEVDREGALRQALREARMAVDAWVKLRSVDGRKTEEARVFLEKVFKLKERRGKGK
ncbi:hypothetical protein B0H65DRAFT_479552 [Neurospora tetraspora]|uniref:SET domain-containing protein n=1 Tax=Neurospora tetraspora TaxID=94610 RepID=A0AAE0MN47_9PEZI|nr:hypothetical protein B0H65DRAFT_479552 [Neurospora tetraspora]